MNNKKGNAIVFATIVVFIVLVIGTSVLYLSENEARKSVRSNLQNATFYIAEGGLHKAMWDLNRDSSYTGESNTALGKGAFTVTVNTPAGQPDQREVTVLGKIGWSRRKIKALSEKIPANIIVTSALACGGNVSMGGTANIVGDPLIDVVVPDGSAVTISGAATAQDTSHAPFPDFQTVFGVTMDAMKDYATTKYTNPGNNADCNGITWVEGDFKATANDWRGSGILIVNGNFDIDGGLFTGVIYVVGAFSMSGNAQISGSILSQSSVEVTGIYGTADIFYNAAAIEQANNSYPFRIVSWQEVKNQI